MTSCMVQVHFWTVKNIVTIPEKDIACYSYHDKKEVGGEQKYTEEKCSFVEGRDITWTPTNKRPEKLRDTLKETEVLLAQSSLLHCQWLSRTVLELVLSSGVVITYTASPFTGDVEHIVIDRTLVGKLSADNPCEVLVADNYLIFCYPDQAKLDYLYLTRKPELQKKVEKLSAFDPKLSTVDLVGPKGRQFQRHLTCSWEEDMVACWWPTASFEAWPWSPMTSEADRANLVLYSANGPRLDMIAYTRTDLDPVGLCYGLIQQQQIFCLQQAPTAMEVCIMEYHKNKIQKISSSSLSVKSPVTCYARSSAEDRVVFACEDNSVMMYDHVQKVSSKQSCAIRVQSLAWHPSDLIIFALSTTGQVQVMDMALNLLQVKVVAEEPCPVPTLNLGVYFKQLAQVKFTSWCPLLEHYEPALSECCDSLAIAFDKGPIAILQLYLGALSQGHMTSLSLTHEFIKHNQVQQAINLLGVINWSHEPSSAFTCLSAIVNHLLKNVLNPEREGQLESTLAMFYAPVRPLSESCILHYRDAMSRLARRFFHQLLRYSRFEKAYLLAVDIGARDLFMDLYYIATDKGELALAHMAQRKAQEIQAQSLLASEAEDDEDDAEIPIRDEDYSSDDGMEDVATPHNGFVPVPPEEFADVKVTRSRQAVVRQTTGTSPGTSLAPAAERLVRQAEQSIHLAAPPEYTLTLGSPQQLPTTAAPKAYTQAGPEPKKTTLKVTHFGIV